MNLNDLSPFQVIRRDGHVVPFDALKIRNAIANAFLKDADGNPRRHGELVLATSERAKADSFTEQVVVAVTRRKEAGETIGIEDIQDQVELVLMRAGEHDIARDYVLFRDRRALQRKVVEVPTSQRSFTVIDGGTRRTLGEESIRAIVEDACKGIVGANPAPIVEQAIRDLYNDMPIEQVDEAVLMAARAMIEKDPAYDRVTALVFLRKIRHEVLGHQVNEDGLASAYVEHFQNMVEQGVAADRFDPRLSGFDLERLGNALKPVRDRQFRFHGLQTLYDRYFTHVQGRRIEMPQSFFMRVAMGLALNEVDKDEKAVEFYEVLSSFRFMSSTPTLFNSGAKVPQLSSCYLTTVGDDLEEIYEAIKENAMLQKFAGGLGNDWTPVRALGSWIKGTNGKSQGVIPFLKVVNDTAVAVNQGGRRKGAVCCYLETWHLDIEEFLELRKNTGDERRRTHDMNSANWIPDLFMKRVMEGGEWTLFSPVDVPDLHEKYGREFEMAYTRYEAKAALGEITHFKKLPAVQLWRKMLSMLYETGHPWIAFKDPCNIRSPQQHVGVVHSSNLCTEITLNTSASEIAVCNLGSVNLAAHLVKEEGGEVVLNLDLLKATVTTAIRMLDNVIEVNFYSVEKARDSNFAHRPIGLGVMGWQDMLHEMRIPFASDEAVDLADGSMEAIAYYAFWASTELAKERGPYASYAGSLWDQGVLPIDSIGRLENERGGYLEVDRYVGFDWEELRVRIKQYGMRNSNCLAIAPTATIANIVGVSASIEPTYQNLFVKSNLSGEFTVVNEFLVSDLKKLGVWDDVMLADLKYFDGSVQQIDRIPEGLKCLYTTAFEIDQKWSIEQASRRQKWIDQAQSLNLYFKQPSGRTLDEVYKLAWIRGLKTTYYLRSLGATAAEKSTGRAGALNAVSSELKACSIDNPDCESCQ
ncbi:MAG: ribonucleoside-diphosphate reductase subunit alpha [Hydrogenophilales bacterium 17-61-9]|nr:MAG: ribonucleoside-diphosphate reductase subunit alpha [Hydrogenophilales bacterium 17-61-9]